MILEDLSDGETNMYVHHALIIPAFPLCTAWLDCPIKGGERGMVLLELELYGAEVFSLTGFEHMLPLKATFHLLMLINELYVDR